MILSTLFDYEWICLVHVEHNHMIVYGSRSTYYIRHSSTFDQKRNVLVETRGTWYMTDTHEGARAQHLSIYLHINDSIVCMIYAHSFYSRSNFILVIYTRNITVQR